MRRDSIIAGLRSGLPLPQAPPQPKGHLWKLILCRQCKLGERNDPAGPIFAFRVTDNWSCVRSGCAPGYGCVFDAPIALSLSLSLSIDMCAQFKCVNFGKLKANVY